MALRTFSPNTKISSSDLNSNFSGLSAGTEISNDAITPSKVSSGVTLQTAVATRAVTNFSTSSTSYVDITDLSVTLNNVEANSTLLVWLTIGTFSCDTSGSDAHITLNIDPPDAAAADDDATAKLFHRAGAASPLDYKPGTIVHRIAVGAGQAGTWIIKARAKCSAGTTLNIGGGVAGSTLMVMEIKG